MLEKEHRKTKCCKQIKNVRIIYFYPQNMFKAFQRFSGNGPVSRKVPTIGSLK